MRFLSFSSGKTLALLRIYLGITFLLHGSARIYLSSLNDFGAFLDGQGLIFGLYLAWAITLGEIIGGFLIAIGYKIKYILPFNFLVILGGIYYVHFTNGYFVVGHGQGGIEYSLLILFVILVLYSNADKKIA